MAASEFLAALLPAPAPNLLWLMMAMFEFYVPSAINYLCGADGCQGWIELDTGEGMETSRTSGCSDNQAMVKHPTWLFTEGQDTFVQGYDSKGREQVIFHNVWQSHPAPLARLQRTCPPHKINGIDEGNPRSLTPWEYFTPERTRVIFIEEPCQSCPAEVCDWIPTFVARALCGG